MYKWVQEPGVVARFTKRGRDNYFQPLVLAKSIDYSK